MNKIRVYTSAFAGGLVARLGVLCLLLALVTGCRVWDDQSDCPRGITLRFVFDYNLERANAFHSQVDCITVYVFDNNGNFITSFTENSDVLADENYRMNFPLQPGDYRLIVLGGTSCPQNSFEVTEFTRAAANSGSVFVRLPLDDDRTSSKPLHDLFYGAVDNLRVLSDDYQEHTVRLIKDTNTVQVMLQELTSPYIVDSQDYEFAIEADNNLLDHDNITIPDGGMEYLPHTIENRIVGMVNPNSPTVNHDNETPVQVAYTEFSLSRIMCQNAESSYIVIRKKSTGSEIVRLPLIEYMLVAKSSYQSWIEDNQEFLDRQSHWSFMFFLQSGRWLQTRIAVNNWIVRTNDAIL